MAENKNETSANANELRCPDCDGAFDKDWQETTIPYGAGENAVDIPVCLPLYTCIGCGLQTLDEEGERLEHEAVCDYLGILSPREIKNIRKRHGMTREEFAELTAIGESSLGRWERALNMQSVAYDNYLRLLDRPAIFSLLQKGLSTRNDVRVEHPNVITFPNIPRTDQEKLRLESENFSLGAVA